MICISVHLVLYLCIVTSFLSSIICTPSRGYMRRNLSPPLDSWLVQDNRLQLTKLCFLRSFLSDNPGWWCLCCFYFFCPRTATKCFAAKVTPPLLFLIGGAMRYYIHRLPDPRDDRSIYSTSTADRDFDSQVWMQVRVREVPSCRSYGLQGGTRASGFVVTVYLSACLSG